MCDVVLIRLLVRFDTKQENRGHLVRFGGFAVFRLKPGVFLFSRDFGVYTIAISLYNIQVHI